jgi:cupin fold WbuC family metalloprotein
VKIINRQLLDELTAAAVKNPRKRQNWNIHPNDGHLAHRLLNAFEPDTYVRPHRHLDPHKDETFMIVRGRLGVILFADDGTVQETLTLDSCGEVMGVDIPNGLFHTAVSLKEGTIFFESKAGPYLPLTSEETPCWAPETASAKVCSYLQSLKNLFRG